MGSVSDVTPFFRILKNKNTRGKMLFSEKLDTTACKYTEINTHLKEFLSFTKLKNLRQMIRNRKTHH